MQLITLQLQIFTFFYYSDVNVGRHQSFRDIIFLISVESDLLAVHAVKRDYYRHVPILLTKILITSINLNLRICLLSPFSC